MNAGRGRGTHHSRGLVGALPKLGMGRRQYQVQFQPAQILGAQVETAVGENVGLDAFQQPKAAGHRVIELIDLAVLPSEVGRREASRERQAERVVGDR